MENESIKKYNNKNSIEQKSTLPIINTKMYEYIQISKKESFFFCLLKQEKALTEKMYEYIKNRKISMVLIPSTVFAHSAFGELTK